VSGLALLLGLDGRPADLVHHEIAFPADYDAEFDDCFVHRRPVRDPTIYACAPAATDPGDAPPGREARFVLVNAPAGVRADWDAEAERLVDRMGVRARLRTLVVRSPAELERATGAVGGAIYGAAPHGRLGALRRSGQRLRGVDGLWLVGGTVHPGGGLPLVALGAQTVAREVGPAAASGSRPFQVPVEA
jgi:phytoene dehydrogenase-like protein